MIFIIAYVIMFLPVVLLFPTKVINKEKLPKRGNKAILTSNHYSNWDPVMYGIFTCRKFRYMTKKELFENKFVSFFAKSLGGFPVDRENMSPSTFKTVMTELKQNHQIFIFPEGTRNKSGSKDLLEIKSGFLTLASKGECAITPMLMYRRPKVFRKNYIIVGDKFELVGENPKRLTKEELDDNFQRYLNVLADLRKEMDNIVEGKNKHKCKNK